jgi:hypothetical protein
VGVEVSMAGNPNAWFAAGRGFVPMGATGSIPVQAPGPVDGVRIVIQANHGGPLLCAAEIAVIGNPAGAAMPNFGAPGGKFAPMESTKLGWQPPKEDVSGGKDWVHPDAGKAGWNDPYAKAGASMGKSDEWNDPYAKAGAPMAKSDWNDSGGKQTWQEQKANAPAYESTKVGWTPPQDDGFSGGKMAAGPAGVGARVVAERYDGGWFEGTVRQSNAGMYEVAWDDGSPPQWLKAEQVQFQ